MEVTLNHALCISFRAAALLGANTVMLLIELSPPTSTVRSRYLHSLSPKPAPKIVSSNHVPKHTTVSRRTRSSLYGYGYGPEAMS